MSHKSVAYSRISRNISLPPLCLRRYTSSKDQLGSNTEIARPHTGASEPRSSSLCSICLRIFAHRQCMGFLSSQWGTLQSCHHTGMRRRWGNEPAEGRITGDLAITRWYRGFGDGTSTLARYIGGRHIFST